MCNIGLFTLLCRLARVVHVEADIEALSRTNSGKTACKLLDWSLRGAARHVDSLLSLLSSFLNYNTCQTRTLVLLNIRRNIRNL